MDILDAYSPEDLGAAKAAIKAAGLDEVCPYSTPRLFRETHSQALWLLEGQWAEYAQAGGVEPSLGDVFPK